MIVTDTYNWNRRNFRFTGLCQHCLTVIKDEKGYDDCNFYNNVIPNIKCKSYNESTNSKTSGMPVIIVTPKYPSFVTF